MRYLRGPSGPRSAFGDRFWTHSATPGHGEKWRGVRRFGPCVPIHVDHFTDVNDTTGYAVGEEVISEVARRLANEGRPDDFWHDSGGDEFGLRCLSSAPTTPRGALRGQVRRSQLCQS